MPHLDMRTRGTLIAQVSAVVIGTAFGHAGLVGGAGAVPLPAVGSPPAVGATSVGGAKNQASSRALKGPAFPGARRCPGTVDVESLIGFDVRVRGASCSTATGAVRKARFRGDRVTIKGCRCRAVNNYTDGGFYRCSRARVTIQFGLGV